ncbi:MAG: hypothetical protein HC811_14430, partial [Flammeovirgaceae bacterium]|nr:hypothetical protein [Flammeovirgaceae bacterium]
AGFPFLRRIQILPADPFPFLFFPMNYRFVFIPLLIIIFGACSSQEEKIFGDEISTSSEQILAGKNFLKVTSKGYYNLQKFALAQFGLSGVD